MTHVNGQFDEPSQAHPDMVDSKKKKKKKKKRKDGSVRAEAGDGNEEEAEENDDDDDEEKRDVQGESTGLAPSVDCGQCGKSIPTTNLQLHLLRCPKKNPSSKLREQKTTQNPEKCGARAQTHPKTSSASSPSSSGKNSQSGKQPQQQKQQQKQQQRSKDLLKETSSDDFDELLRLADKMNNVCNLKGCKTNIHVLGQECEFCNRRFCLSHHMAEIHGCGDAVRAKAKKNSIKVRVHMPWILDDYTADGLAGAARQ